MKKVLLICPDIEFTNYRGIQSVFKTLVNDLKVKNCEVYVLSGFKKPRIPYKNKALKSTVLKAYLYQYLFLGRKLYMEKYLIKPYSILNSIKEILNQICHLLFSDTDVIKGKTTSKNNIFYKCDYFVNSEHIYQYLDLSGKSIIAKIIFYYTLKKIIKSLLVEEVYVTSPQLVRVKKPSRLISYVHDIMPLILKEEPLENNTILDFSKKLNHTLKYSNKILVNSLDTKAHISNLNQNCQIEVLTPEVKDVSELETTLINRTTLEIYGLLPKKYFYFVSSMEKRKNIKNIIKGYLFSFKVTRQKLVLSGSPGYEFHKILEYLMPFWRAQEILLISYSSKITIPKIKGQYKFELKNKTKNNKPTIIFTGYVDEKLKFLFLAHCSAHVFPSFYEGYGIPIKEAQSFNIPSITTVKGALSEVVNANDIIVTDPSNPYEISEKMKIFKS